MCLLHRCVQCRGALGLRDLQVAHVHHGMRGADADADAQLVQDTCERLGIRFHLLRLDPLALQGPGGFECRARDARYTVLQQLRERLGLQWLATAHHRDDQAETVCLRLLRGTTLWGLQGVLAQRADGVVRPLLQASRQELLEFAARNGVSWREDRSNESDDYARNRVRHHLLPALERSSPGAGAQLARLAQKAQQIWPGLARRLDDYFGPCRGTRPAWMDLPWLAPQGPCLGLRAESLRALVGDGSLLRLWLWSQGLSWKASAEEGRCWEALENGRLGRMRLGSVLVEMTDGTLWWTDQRSWSLPADKMYLFTMLRLGSDGPSDLPSAAYSAQLDADQIPADGCLELRTRRDGDRFSPPLLRSRRRKLKQWLQESGVPSFVRDRLWVVAYGSEVVWIPGFGVSGNYRRELHSTNVLELRLEWKKNP